MSPLTIVPSTMFALATVTPVGNAPVLSFAAGVVPSANLAPDIFAELLMSSLTIEPSTMFAEFTVMPDLSNPSAILLLSIAAFALMSALTIVSSAISVEVTAPAFIFAVIILFLCSVAANLPISCMALRSAALIEEPAANTAAGVFTFVSLYICTFPLPAGAAAPRVTVVPLTEYSPLPGVPVV